MWFVHLTIIYSQQSVFNLYVMFETMIGVYTSSLPEKRRLSQLAPSFSTSVEFLENARVQGGAQLRRGGTWRRWGRGVSEVSTWRTVIGYRIQPGSQIVRFRCYHFSTKGDSYWLCGHTPIITLCIIVSSVQNPITAIPRVIVTYNIYIWPIYIMQPWYCICYERR